MLQLPTTARHRATGRPTSIFGLLPAALSALLLLFLASLAGAQPDRQMDKLVLADGFEIEIWAEGVENARAMARGEGGTVFAGSRRKGYVHAVVDQDGDGSPDRVLRIAEGLNMPSGLAFRDGDLYVAEVNRVLRYDDIENNLESPPEPVVVQGGLPEDKHHGWKFIRFGPDGKLYVPVGAPCNVCDVEDPYATILRMDPETGDYDVYARGVRNTVGFDWHPVTRELWFTDNGRDMMGDDLPADELNRITEVGQNFGFPFCHQGDTPDPEFSDRGTCAEAVPPVQNLGPHVAALGMRFYLGDALPERLHGQILIAEHGSWNRSEPIGYRITAVTLDGQGGAVKYETLVDGWLQGKKGWGRPADVMELPDGSILISDDLQGVIYRLTYSGSSSAASPSTASHAGAAEELRER